MAYCCQQGAHYLGASVWPGFVLRGCFFFFTGASAATQRNRILTRHHKTTWYLSVYRSTRVGSDPMLTDLAQPWNCIFTTDQLQIIVRPVIEDMFLQIRRLCVITSTHTHPRPPIFIMEAESIWFVITQLQLLFTSWLPVEKNMLWKKRFYIIFCKFSASSSSFSSFFLSLSLLDFTPLSHHFLTIINSQDVTLVQCFYFRPSFLL